VLDEGDSVSFWPISNPTIANQMRFARKTIVSYMRQATCHAKESQNMINGFVPLHVCFHILDFDRGLESNANPVSGRAFPMNMFRYIPCCHL